MSPPSWRVQAGAQENAAESTWGSSDPGASALPGWLCDLRQVLSRPVPGAVGCSVTPQRPLLLDPGEAELLNIFEFVTLRFSSLKILGPCHPLRLWAGLDPAPGSLEDSEAPGGWQEAGGASPLVSSAGHSPGQLTPCSAASGLCSIPELW